jgi:hypothetical protein
MRAISINFSSAWRSHTWQIAQKYGGTSPIVSWRLFSRMVRSVLGRLKSSIIIEVVLMLESTRRDVEMRKDGGVRESLVRATH